MSKETDTVVWIRIAVAAMCGIAALAMQVRRADAGGCHTYQCGGNSPILFGQPLANLRLDGAPNPNGVQLVVDSLTKVSACMSGATPISPDQRLRLAVADGGLIGIDPANPATRCQGPSLLGAEFDIVVMPPFRPGARTLPKPHKVTVRIAEIGKIRTWVRSVKRREVLPTYKFVVVTPGETSNFHGVRKIKVKHPAGVALCSNRLTYEDWQDFSGVDALADREDMMAGTMVYPDRWTEPKDHALIVQGEAFTDDGSRLPTTSADATWVNFACAATSVAKMRMLGVNPMDQGLPTGATSATLKMLGARYDGIKAETKPGTPIMWIRMWDVKTSPTIGSPKVGAPPAVFDAKVVDEGFFGGPSDEMEPGPIEAGWDAGGATCLSHFRPPMIIGNARAARTGGYAGIIAATEMNHVRARQRVIGRSACDESNLPVGTLWVTVTVDHPVHTFSLPDAFTVAGGVTRAYGSGSVPHAVAAKLRPIDAPPNPIPPVVKPPTGPQHPGTSPGPGANPGNPTIVKPPVVVPPIAPPTVVNPPVVKPPGVK